MSYGEQIRHPSGALDPAERGAKRRTLPLWFWMLLALVGIAIFLELRRGKLPPLPPAPPVNPFGWK